MVRQSEPLRFPILIIIVASLAIGCARDDLQSSSGRPIDDTVAPPTPTLLPGLSTTESTAETAATPSNPDLATPRPFPTPTPLPTPTATPVPVERLRLGEVALRHENFALAVEHFRAFVVGQDPSEDGYMDALDGLGRALFHLDRHAEAIEAFGQMLSMSADQEVLRIAPEESSDPGWSSSEGYFFLGQSYEAMGNCEAAVHAYDKFLEQGSAVAAYVLPKKAACLQSIGREEDAFQAFEEASSAAAQPVTQIANLRKLADNLRGQGSYLAAADVYLQISRLATRDEEKGQAVYDAGFVTLQAGDPAAGYELYREAVSSYPKAHASYLALQALLEAGVDVNDLQRGIVDYYAEAYEPAIVVLQRYIGSNAIHDERVHLFLAWTYEAQGDVTAALGEIDAFIAAVEPNLDDATEVPENFNAGQAAEGWLERAKLLARNGQLLAAAESYHVYVERYPDGEEGPFAAWWAAALTERAGNPEDAAALYLELADIYPDHEDAPEAIFRAGLLLFDGGNQEDGKAYWERAAEEYRQSDFGAASVVWLMRTATEVQDRNVRSLVAGLTGDGYYAIRARHIASGTKPFASPPTIELNLVAGSQAEAESWLKAYLDLPEDYDVTSLSENLLSDGRFVRGQILWRLGLREEAKLELEDLRKAYAQNVLVSYQLALRFMEIGLYRSSILSASTVMDLAGVSVFTAPKFIATLAYPVYYSELVLAQAQRYDYDPLLQFALIRQESLFESFATSSAVAQGLSQVIPATGAYIAQRLDWPDYENENLYHPYVGIAFGAYYLDQQLDAFDGNVAVALSAYNGGPGNAARWYQQESEDFDRYIEVVDFAETRLYIERIYVGQAIYRFLYGE